MTVVVIGAGPQGLSATAFLRQAGVPTRVFGIPMQSWRDGMPAGMRMRSALRATHIAIPGRRLSLHEFSRRSGRDLESPLALATFVDYGLWVARRVAPDVDERMVESVSARPGGGFDVALAGGERVGAERVVVAAGPRPFAHRPGPLRSLDGALVSHTSEHADLRGFAGREVLVVGAGQSALEAVALLHEGGARPELAARAAGLRWLRPHSDGAAASRFGVPLPPTGVGGALSGWLAALPAAYRSLPAAGRRWVTGRCMAPAGSHDLRARTAGVPLRLGEELRHVHRVGGRVAVAFSRGGERAYDHVLLATGYRVDVSCYTFLPGELRAGLRTRDGCPLLGPGLESSVAGLHFLGAAAAGSFGPIMNFVVGAWYAAPELTRRVAGRRRPLLRPAF